jgi:CHAT domain-containing protein
MKMADHSSGKYGIRLVFQYPESSLSEAAEKSVSLDEIEKGWREAVEKINVASRPGNGVIPNAVSDKLKGVGQQMAALFPEITEKLSNTDADFLILEIDARLVHLPWELLYDIKTRKFICERFSMGRIPHTVQTVRTFEKRELKKPFNMWILAEPGADLPNADSEARDICNYIDGKMNADEEVIYADVNIGGISPGEVREKIKDYDFVHFAGHADYHSLHSGQSGWRLKDGNFTQSDIESIGGVKAMPALVFSNACQSARTGKWEQEKGDRAGAFGLANAFMLAGVRHYLGTSWEIKDEPGKKFALLFYEYLLSGNSVGEAVRQARRDLAESDADISWASYVMYGDPKANYFGINGDADNWIKLQITVVKDIRLPSEEKITRRSFMSAGVLIIAFVIALLSYLLYRTPPPSSVLPADEKEQIRVFQEKIREKKKQIDGLWKKYIEFSGNPEILSADDWTSLPLTLVPVFESQLSPSDQKKAELIAAALQSELGRHDTGFTLLYRQSFDLLLEELIRGIEAGQLRPGRLKMPGYLLFIELNQDESRNVVLMNLVESETRRELDASGERVEPDVFVFEQKQRLAQKILTWLKGIEAEPVRGLISEVADERILLNVGADHGVKIGQQFRVIDQDSVLEVEGLKRDGKTCVARMKAGEIFPEKGLKIEEALNH